MAIVTYTTSIVECLEAIGSPYSVAALWIGCAPWRQPARVRSPRGRLAGLMFVKLAQPDGSGLWPGPRRLENHQPIGARSLGTDVCKPIPPPRLCHALPPLVQFQQLGHWPRAPRSVFTAGVAVRHLSGAARLCLFMLYRLLAYLDYTKSEPLSIYLQAV